MSLSTTAFNHGIELEASSSITGRHFHTDTGRYNQLLQTFGGMELKPRSFMFVFGTAMIGFSLWYHYAHRDDKDNLTATGVARPISEESLDKYAILSRKTLP